MALAIDIMDVCQLTLHSYYFCPHNRCVRMGVSDPEAVNNYSYELKFFSFCIWQLALILWMGVRVDFT